MAQVQYVKDENGDVFIPGSRRPDGTFRKPRRVKEGYIPQDEMPLYESKGRQFTRGRKDYPVGLAPDDVAKHRAGREAAEKAENAVHTVRGGGAGIPGLAAPAAKPTKKNKSKPKKSAADKPAPAAVDESLVEALSRSSIAPAPELPPTESEMAEHRAKLKNLKKKLKDVTTLAERVRKGEVTPDAEQTAKIGRRQTLMEEIKTVENLLGR